MLNGALAFSIIILFILIVFFVFEQYLSKTEKHQLSVKDVSKMSAQIEKMEKELKQLENSIILQIPEVGSLLTKTKDKLKQVESVAQIDKDVLDIIAKLTGANSKRDRNIGILIGILSTIVVSFVFFLLR